MTLNPKQSAGAALFSNREPRSRFRFVLRFTGMLLCLSIVVAGCGYQVGSPYSARYKTIDVPVFKTNSYRRGFEYQLTEAVQREVQSQTHFRLAKGANADTRLIGTIVEVRKDVLGETAFDDPRELQLSIAVELKWIDARTGQVLSQHSVPLNGQSTHLIATGEFAPEVGHSLATATQATVDDLARQIVEQLESPW